MNHPRWPQDRAATARSGRWARFWGRRAPDTKRHGVEKCYLIGLEWILMEFRGCVIDSSGMFDFSRIQWGFFMGTHWEFMNTIGIHWVIQAAMAGAPSMIFWGHDLSIGFLTGGSTGHRSMWDDLSRVSSTRFFRRCSHETLQKLGLFASIHYFIYIWEHCSLPTN